METDENITLGKSLAIAIVIIIGAMCINVFTSSRSAVSVQAEPEAAEDELMLANLEPDTTAEQSTQRPSSTRARDSFSSNTSIHRIDDSTVIIAMPESD